MHTALQSLRSVRQHRDLRFPLALVHSRCRVVGTQQAEQNDAGHTDCRTTGAEVEKDRWRPSDCHRDASRM